jgi:hypothetical protein
MVRTVELFPRGSVLQAVVRAGVDHYRALGELGRDLGGGPVREREEHDVVPGQVLHAGVLENPARQAMEMRLQFA